MDRSLDDRIAERQVSVTHLHCVPTDYELIMLSQRTSTRGQRAPPRRNDRNDYPRDGIKKVSFTRFLSPSWRLTLPRRSESSTSSYNVLLARTTMPSSRPQYLSSVTQQERFNRSITFIPS